MQVSRWILQAGFSVIVASGCSPEGSGDVPELGDERDDVFLVEGKADTGGIAEGTPEALGCLAVVNKLSLTDLKTKVGLASNAASAIDALRKGDDEIKNTADDVTFTTLKQLDDVPFVGPLAFGKLLAYARANGFVNMPGTGGNNGPYGKWTRIKQGAKCQNCKAFWTGKEMLLWGHSGQESAAQAYNPATDTWRDLNKTRMPANRRDAAVAWSGKELYVFGGYSTVTSRYAGDGARYNPELDTWTDLPYTAAPSGREHATMLWTGDRMIVFGGHSEKGTTNTGSEYIPRDNLWVELPTAFAPTPRAGMAGVYTGTEVLVWGGWETVVQQHTFVASGGMYNPVTRTWRAITTTNAPKARGLFASAWTGTEFLIWGGRNTMGNDWAYFNDGARYNPKTNTWTPLPTSTLTPRASVSGLFTGSEFVLFGGSKDGNFYGNGARLVLANNTWRILSIDDSPSGRSNHASLWTGSSMIVMGGETQFGSIYNDGGIWTP